MRVWTQMDALLVLMLMLGSLVALNQVLDLEVVTLMPRSGQVVARSAGLTVTYCLELALIALLASRHGVSFGSSLGMRPVARSIKSAAVSSLLVVALLVAARLLTAVYGYVSQQFGWEPVFEWGGDLTQVFGRGWAGLSLTLVLVVFLGPFVEELAFRGVVQSAARRRWGMWASIATTSLIFAVYHFDPWMFVPTFVLSLALGWLAENRRGLWPSIATHVLYNGVTVAAAFWFVAEQGTRV